MSRRVGVWVDGPRVVSAEVADGVCVAVDVAEAADEAEAIAAAKKRRRRGPRVVCFDGAGVQARDLQVRPAPEEVVRAQVRQQMSRYAKDGALAVCGRPFALPTGQGAAAGALSALGAAAPERSLAAAAGIAGGDRGAVTVVPFVLPAGCWVVLGWERCWAVAVRSDRPAKARFLESGGVGALVGRLGGGPRAVERALQGAGGGEEVDRFLQALARDLRETELHWQDELRRELGPWCLLGPEVAVFGAFLEEALGRAGVEVSMPRSLSSSGAGGVGPAELAAGGVAIAAASAEVPRLERLEGAPKGISAADRARAALGRRWRRAVVVTAAVAVLIGAPLVGASIVSSSAGAAFAATSDQEQALASYAALGSYVDALSADKASLLASAPAFPGAVSRLLASAPAGVVVDQIAMTSVGRLLTVEVQAAAPVGDSAAAVSWADALQKAGAEGPSVTSVARGATDESFDLSFEEES